MESPQFARTSKADWIRQTKADLKTDDLNQLLNWEPFKGITMGAYYDLEERKSIETLSRFFTHIRYQPCQLLEAVKVTDFKSANQLALEGLSNGATGVLFQLSDWNSSAAPSLLKEILPEHCMIAFEGDHVDEAADWFSNHFAHQSEQLSGFVVNGKKIDKTGPGFKSLGITVENTVDMASSLGAFLDTLDQFHKIYGSEFGSHLNVCTQLTGKFYQDIAVLRSIRWLTNLWAIDNGVALNVDAIHLHATPILSKDYKSTMLSNTTAGAAGMIGGTNSIHFGLESNKSEEFTRRIARNVGNLLRDESKLVFDQDPVAGSYFIDILTNQLSEQSWNLYTSQS